MKCLHPENREKLLFPLPPQKDLKKLSRQLAVSVVVEQGPGRHGWWANARAVHFGPGHTILCNANECNLPRFFGPLRAPLLPTPPRPLIFNAPPNFQQEPSLNRERKTFQTRERKTGSGSQVLLFSCYVGVESSVGKRYLVLS